MKKILLSLFVGFISVISFCSSNFADTYPPTISVSVNGTGFTRTFDTNSLVCFRVTSNVSCTVNGSTFNNVANLYCDYNGGSSRSLTFNCSKSSGTAGNLYLYTFSSFGNGRFSCPSCPDCPACPEVDTGAILSGYVPESQLISCQSDLFSCNSSLSSCLESSCPETELSYSKFYVKNGESVWSQLSGAEFYYVYLPEYLGFNYDYSNNGRDLDFTVGVGVDTGYLSDVVGVQNYQPTSDDFSKLVGLFGSYGGLLIACLFVIIVFYLIKKLFK